MPKTPSSFPSVIVQLWRLPVVSASVASTVPTLVVSTSSSSTSKLCDAVITGAVSFTSVTLIVTVSVAEVFTPSPTVNVSTYVSVISRFRFVLSATVISPVPALIAKIKSPLPAVMVQLCSDPVVSASVAATVPTLVVSAAPSDTLKLCAAVITGAVSFTSVTLIVTVSVSDVLAPSPTVRVKTYVSVVSRSRFVLSAIVISPVPALIAKMPSPLPAVMVQA